MAIGPSSSSLRAARSNARRFFAPLTYEVWAYSPIPARSLTPLFAAA